MINLNLSNLPEITVYSAYGTYGPRNMHADQIEEARKLAFSITADFEGGETSSLQLLDSGIISYGKHQATLNSGTLYELLERYTESSSHSSAVRLKDYLSAVEGKDSSLRFNNEFINLLKTASKDPIMDRVQDNLFIDKYWKPVVEIAESNGLLSTKTLILLYDTNVQGGLQSILKSTKDKLGPRIYQEDVFLREFLQERGNYIRKVAQIKEKNGDLASAKLLENSVKYRLTKLSSYLLR